MLQPQVSAKQYLTRKYMTAERWAGYFHQIDTVLSQKPKTVLEIGLGNGLVAETLQKFGVHVQTVDIDPELHPTFVASVADLPSEDASVDVVLCAEVLEHLPFEESQKAMREIHRVAREAAVVTLPHAGWTFSAIWKFPLLSRSFFFFKIPHFWKTHQFNGEHYWELGKKGFSREHLRQELLAAGFKTVTMTRYPDDPAHVIYICLK